MFPEIDMKPKVLKAELICYQIFIISVAAALRIAGRTVLCLWGEVFFKGLILKTLLWGTPWLQSVQSVCIPGTEGPGSAADQFSLPYFNLYWKSHVGIWQLYTSLTRTLYSVWQKRVSAAWALKSQLYFFENVFASVCNTDPCLKS